MKLHVPFVQLPLKFDAEALAAEISALGEDGWLPHPEGFPGNSALTLITTGGDPASDRFAGPMRATRWLDRCPYLMQVLDHIGATWGRTRLMRLSGQAEVTAHVDVNYYWRERIRVHVPIITQPTVRFICGESEVNMAAGECWIFDTWRLHRVINDDSRSRIHLVADTVGGDRFWDHVAEGRATGRPRPGWQAEPVGPDPAARPRLDFESQNVPTVMTPWEIREHIVFFLNETEPHPKLPSIQQGLLLFARRWHALWSCYGESRDGWPRYRTVLDETRADAIARGVKEITFRNGIKLMQALTACIFDVALADRETQAGLEVRQQPEPRQ